MKEDFDIIIKDSPITKREQRRKAHEKMMISAFCKRNIGDFFTPFSKHFRPWLHEFTRSYKERGHYPVVPVSYLPSLYSKPKDKEVACYAAMLISDCAMSDAYCREFRVMMGESCYSWFKERSFVSLGISRDRNLRTGGCKNLRIVNFMDCLWDSFREGSCNVIDLPSAINAMMRFGVPESAFRLLSLVLYTSDGIGIGCCDGDKTNLLCPDTWEVRNLLNTFFPDWKRYGSIDDAVRLFCFERDIDFYYAALAYEDLRRRKPTVCSRIATTYANRYAAGFILPKDKWLGKWGVMPSVESLFESEC